MSQFTVDGVFAKHIGAGVLVAGNKDVVFSAGCAIVVADYGNHRICVFSRDGDVLLKTWGCQGYAAGQFYDPKVLAVSGPHLYVLDNTGRVKVFE